MAGTARRPAVALPLDQGLHLVRGRLSVAGGASPAPLRRRLVENVDRVAVASRLPATLRYFRKLWQTRALAPAVRPVPAVTSHDSPENHPEATVAVVKANMRAVTRQARRTLVRPAKHAMGVRYMGSESASSSKGFYLPTEPCKRYAAVTHPEDPASVPPTVKELLDRSNAYILPVYARPPIVMAKGKGSYVWDVQGRQYLDFSSGIAVNALGHGDEGLVEVSALGFIHCIQGSTPWVRVRDLHDPRERRDNFAYDVDVPPAAYIYRMGGR
ncbi:hypothetical protein NUW54_g13817 [Trametes sanguinea]|uniref:Uncharacterized protein n=1 Tax=Trametes sanguinea TaxID=158606 RepID=A0ACC1MIC1_9APHY|nr:hypothetical protein NUW54_g13817 [Trametes sanguinea]